MDYAKSLTESLLHIFLESRQTAVREGLEISLEKDIEHIIYTAIVTAMSKQRYVCAEAYLESVTPETQTIAQDLRKTKEYISIINAEVKL